MTDPKNLTSPFTFKKFKVEVLRFPLKLTAMPLRLLLIALRNSRTPTLLVEPTLPLKVTVPDDSTARFPKPSIYSCSR
jgi:hypothetical protein